MATFAASAGDTTRFRARKARSADLIACGPTLAAGVVRRAAAGAHGAPSSGQTGRRAQGRRGAELGADGLRRERTARRAQGRRRAELGADGAPCSGADGAVGKALSGHITRPATATDALAVSRVCEVACWMFFRHMRV